MGTVVHSPFLQALGYAIINSLWQFALLWLLYFSINTVFKLSSQQKYSAGIVLELGGFIWFVGSLLFYYKQLVLLAAQVTSNNSIAFSGPAAAGTEASLKERFFLFVLNSEQFFPYLSIAYLALLFILAVRWICSYRYTQQVRTKGLIEIAESWQIFVETISLQLGIVNKVNIFLSDIVQTPLTVGFLKPLILIPIAAVNYLDAQQMEAVILHELAHIKRLDYLFNLFLAVVKASLFFNPFMQLIHQQIRKERENCCDDWVLKYEYSATSYARALLQIASNHAHSSLLSLNATDNSRLLINRIKRIIEKKERTFFNYRHQLLALLVMTIVFSLLSFLSPGKKIYSSSTLRGHERVVLEPRVANFNNPLFNPVFFLANPSKPAVEKKKAAAGVVKNRTEANNPADASVAVSPSNPPDFSTGELEVDRVIAETPDDREVKMMGLEDYREIAEDEEKKFRQDKTRQLDIARRQTKLAEKQVEKIQQEFTTIKMANFEKAQVQLKKALEQLKTSSKQLELRKLQGFVKMGIRKLDKEKMPEVPGLNLKADELEMLENQIQAALDSISQPTFYTASFSDNGNLTFQFPAVAYPVQPEQKDYSFSFEYTAKPRVRAVIVPAAAGRLEQMKRKEKEKLIIVEGDEEVRQPTAAAPPTPSGTKIRLRIIRI